MRHMRLSALSLPQDPSITFYIHEAKAEARNSRSMYMLPRQLARPLIHNIHEQDLVTITSDSAVGVIHPYQAPAGSH